MQFGVNTITFASNLETRNAINRMIRLSLFRKQMHVKRKHLSRHCGSSLSFPLSSSSLSSAFFFHSQCCIDVITVAICSYSIAQPVNPAGDAETRGERRFAAHHQDEHKRLVMILGRGRERERGKQRQRVKTERLIKFLAALHLIMDTDIFAEG